MPPKMNKRIFINRKTIFQKKSGSILLEALLATVILGSCVTVIMQSLISGSRAIQYSSFFLTTDLALQNRMEYLFKKGLDDDTQNQITQSDDTSKYEFEEHKVYPDDPQDFLKEVALKVDWQDNGQERNNTVTSWIYDVPQSK